MSNNNTYFSLVDLKASSTSEGTAFLTQASPVVDGLFMWTPGNFTGQSDNQNIIKADSTALSEGAWVRQGTQSIGFRQGGTGAITRTVEAKVREVVSVIDFGADATGSTDVVAAFQAAADYLYNTYGRGTVLVPIGVYKFLDSVYPPTGVRWEGSDALLKAGTNNVTFFKIDGSSGREASYFSRFHGFTLDGGGYSEVVGFDMRNWRLSAGLYDIVFQDTDYGLICQHGCFGSVMVNCSTQRVPNPVRLLNDASSFSFHGCQFDNGPTMYGPNIPYPSRMPLMQTGVGISIPLGSPANVGVSVFSGYVQGFEYGIHDKALGTKLDAVYIEQNVIADVYAQGARGSTYTNVTHPADLGNYAYLLEDCDTITVFKPMMQSGARNQLYKTQGVNNNLVEYRPPHTESYNFPLGDVAAFGQLSIETSGTFTPIVVGTSAPGEFSYTTNAGRWRKCGRRVDVTIEIAWTATNAVGNTTITGIPSNLTPTDFGGPSRRALAIVENVSVAGTPFVYMNGAGTGLSLAVANAGASSLIPVPNAAALTINLSYDI